MVKEINGVKLTGKLELYAHYLDVEENGCDKNCDSCDLFLEYKNVCAIEDEKNRQKWLKKRSQEISELLRSTK